MVKVTQWKIFHYTSKNTDVSTEKECWLSLHMCKKQTNIDCELYAIDVKPWTCFLLVQGLDAPCFLEIATHKLKMRSVSAGCVKEDCVRWTTKTPGTSCYIGPSVCSLTHGHSSATQDIQLMAVVFFPNMTFLSLISIT